MQEEQNLLSQLENQASLILNLVQDQQQQPLELKKYIKNFGENNKNLLQKFTNADKFQQAYHVSKKTEKTFLEILRFMQFQESKHIPLGQILLQTIQSKKDEHPEKKEIKPLMLHKVELYKFDFPYQEQQNLDLQEYLIENLITCINNQGVIYMMRQKPQMALVHFYRAIFARIQYQRDYFSKYQEAALLINLAFTLKNMQQYEDAGQFINKAIIILEYLEKSLNEKGWTNTNIEKESVLMILISFLFKNQNQNQITPDNVNNDQDRLLHILSMGYKYYAEILIKQKRHQESEFCLENAKTFQKKFQQNLLKQKYKPNPNLTKSALQRNFPQFQNLNPAENREQSEDERFSKASFKTTNTSNFENFNHYIKIQHNQNQTQNQNQTINQDLNFNNPNSSPLKLNNINQNNNNNYLQKRQFSQHQQQQQIQIQKEQELELKKENIIYQKYISVNQNRYKIIVTYIKQYNCVQLFLYNKPKNFINSIVIDFQTLLDICKKEGYSGFKDEQSINVFFQDLIHKLKIVKGEIVSQSFPYFKNIEQLLIAQKQAQQENTSNPIIINNKNNFQYKYQQQSQKSSRSSSQYSKIQQQQLENLTQKFTSN
ncbi:hypothetical protein PPERSA_13143 [Pseudocohnilembus persalinus]|uniref:Uncharacterized protein n=1 Tax=Pseudocohnilembus persalinus TaxID=266149 RepID=A0A0V0QBP2_PSEPJ|nr:hypothetical protein PPERSA_13143 [Pseudocohnilembus persalinus]|eukprot:KRW99563.1 hypothetical protein PPERSA_13143 [Pseudocohnilembus persalinus]